uniref:Uncharacterized protein n=1 Tax=Acrobeloides nanus TaxID=290746 RepID=A0A914C2B3_9BILA
MECEKQDLAFRYCSDIPADMENESIEACQPSPSDCGLCSCAATTTIFSPWIKHGLLHFYSDNPFVFIPVKNTSEPLRVKFGASLIRIIDVDEYNQVLTTNLWLEMHWNDYKLSWDPSKYDGLKKINLPANKIWVPDILLYNNADGEPHASTTKNDAIVYYTGLVIWKPPSIYKSFCSIDIEYFPYDSQLCPMKFGGWSYNGFLIDVRQLPSRPDSVIENRKDPDGKEYKFMQQGMDLSYFQKSLEWDVMELTSKRHEQLYPGCCGQDMYIDITFEISLLRKSLIYTVNLVIPCMLNAILSTFVFYIPAMDLKITFSISILITLTVFYLILNEMIPPTSLVLPLIGKYLLFTMFLATASILFSVVVINVYRRNSFSQPMPFWMRKLFLYKLPYYLKMKPLTNDEIAVERKESSISRAASPTSSCAGSMISDTIPLLPRSRRASPLIYSVYSLMDSELRLSNLALQYGMHPYLFRRIIDNIAFIHEHFRILNEERKISREWSYMATVMDRCLLIIFAILNFLGTIIIFFQAPSWYDTRVAMDVTTPMKPLSGDAFDI